MEGDHPLAYPAVELAQVVFHGRAVERWGSHGTVVQYPISDCGIRVLPVAVMDTLWVAYPDGIPKIHE